MKYKTDKFIFNINDFSKEVNKSSGEINHCICSIIVEHSKNNHDNDIRKIFNICSRVSNYRFNHNGKYLNEKQISGWLFEYAIPEENSFKLMLESIYEAQNNHCFCKNYSGELWNVYVEIRDDICNLMVEMREKIKQKDIETAIFNLLERHKALITSTKSKKKSEKKNHYSLGKLIGNHYLE